MAVGVFVTVLVIVMVLVAVGVAVGDLVTVGVCDGLAVRRGVGVKVFVGVGDVVHVCVGVAVEVSSIPTIIRFDIFANENPYLTRVIPMNGDPTLLVVTESRAPEYAVNVFIFRVTIGLDSDPMDVMTMSPGESALTSIEDVFKNPAGVIIQCPDVCASLKYALSEVGLLPKLLGPHVKLVFVSDAMSTTVKYMVFVPMFPPAESLQNEDFDCELVVAVSAI